MVKELAMPEGLDDLGRRAHAIILAFLEKRDLTWTGGGCGFHSPGEWMRDYMRDDGVAFDGSTLKLVFIHDGGEPSSVFNPPPHHEAEAQFESVSAELEAAGMYPELYDSVTTCVWVIPPRGPKILFRHKQSGATR